MSLLDDINNGNVPIYTDVDGRQYVIQQSGMDGVLVDLDTLLKQMSPVNSYQGQVKGLLGQWSSLADMPQVQQYLSQIDTPDELAYMRAKFDPTKIPHLEELTYQLAGFGNQQNVNTWLKQQGGQTLTPLESMLIDNPSMAGQSVVRPDIPDLYQGVANPNAADGGPVYTQALYDKYGVTPADYSQAATNWAANNTAAAQAARDDDGGLFGDILPLVLAGAGLYFGLPGLLGEAGAGTLGAIGGIDAGALAAADMAAGLLPASELAAMGVGAGTAAGLGGLADAGYLNTLGEWGSMAAPAAPVADAAVTSIADIASVPVSPLLNTGGTTAVSPAIASAAGVPSVAPIATTTGGLLTPAASAANAAAATTAGIDAAIPSIVSAPATGGLTLADLAPATGTAATAAGGVSPAIAAAAGVPSITEATAGLAGLDPAIAAAAGVPSTVGGVATGVGTLAGSTPGAALTAAQLAGIAAPAATAATSSGLFGNIANALGVSTNTLTGLLGTGLNALSGYMNTSNAADAAAQQAATQLKIADMFRFRPVGVTTRFGSSQFGYDPVTGNLNSASYNVSPEVKALQDSLMGAAPGLLGQFTGAQAATAPMGTAAQAAMNLGNQYLATSPQAQAQKYMDEQMALLQPQNERALAALEAKLQAQGRLGLATGGTSTLGASNPELEALYNAQKMQQLQLAAAATQGGMDYAKFGTAMAGAGGNLLNSMYSTQNAAFNPYNTALTGANTIEQLGQNAMNLGTSIGARQSTANAIPANMMNQAAATQATANAASPWASLLGGVGSTLQNNSLLSALTNTNLWGT